MKKLFAIIFSVIGLVSMLPNIALAAGQKAPPLVVVAYTKNISGISLWWQIFTMTTCYFSRF